LLHPIDLPHDGRHFALLSRQIASFAIPPQPLPLSLAGFGMQVAKWVRNVALATHAILGAERRQKWGRAARKVRVGGDEKLKDKRQKETKHKQEGGQGKGKGGQTVEKRNVLCQRERTR
jgi:hypothetical protein